ncbi:amidase [Kribbella sp. VKM Ac-2527]|uniref:Amidase n=1 Tax=Kribbella caucasensis TaxID=2512215 RepID=A0A4R6K251_9ACTN|nr:amidase family protein [Kribbella sp. VKM Ac-2527]TDO43300.1 amidase [Kribbella sp. VKM Ac-2527]
MTENEFSSATELAAEIRQGKASSRDVTAALLDRIAADSTINAVVETRAEFALAAAETADRAVASGRELGPLHGVPMTVKEAINVAGLHTTWGNPDFASYVADEDALVVRRLQDAGAIVIGKTNAHEMLSDFGQTDNEIYGRTNNPVDPTRTPGGSSGGSAAALAAGLTNLEYGSDLAGSIRLPASYCGVYGLRPTAGVVPLKGFQPPGPPALETEFPPLSAIGPMARSAADLRTALTVTGGPATAPGAWRLQPSRHRRLPDFRIGVVLDHPYAPVSGDVGDVLSALVDDLARRGVKIFEGWPEGVDAGAQAEAFGFQMELFFALYGSDPDFASLGEVIEQEHRRMAARSAWQRFFGEVDAFLCATSFTAAFPHDSRSFDERTITTTAGEQPYAAQGFWIAPAAYTGLPALSMPAGATADGLPVGLQVIGDIHNDDTIISFAELVAD